MNKIKLLIGIFAAALLTAIAQPVFARQVVVEENSESMIMLDVARRYYPVDEIKQYIDTLAIHENSTLQLHFTDDENVGIECTYLDQTKANATVSGNIYTNPVTNKPFLTYEQVTDLMNYADSKKVRFVPEIDIPAHMTGFINLAEQKFGYDYVHDSTTGIAWKQDTDPGNVDFLHQNGHDFIMALYDEYTEFFKSREYFHMGFDEYTLRNDEKIAFANEMYDYLANKGYKVRMWSDAVTSANINSLNNNIEIIYWGWWDDAVAYGYATVPEFQEAGFKIIVTNRWYLFLVPSVANMTPENNAHTIRDIKENWELESWNYNFPSTLNNHDNILGGAICIWGENSAGVTDQAIREQGTEMYEAMFKKLDIHRRIIDAPDEEETSNPQTEDTIKYYIISGAACAVVLIICVVVIVINKKKQ
ncbi:family 20 glycosylhydrolase [Candidatus Saccharibacteria bacterium]|nr:family 20 glycosylhydrolase [Candidatus Saccharibacteria bacterium]